MRSWSKVACNPEERMDARQPPVGSNRVARLFQSMRRRANRWKLGKDAQARIAYWQNLAEHGDQLAATDYPS